MTQHNSNTPENKKDSWGTPDWLFNWLNSIFNFDIDLAASWDNKKCKNHFSIEYTDSLKEDWLDHGSVGFLNPPYSNVRPWINKAIEQQKCGFKTVMVIPMPNGQSYYQDLMESASELIFIHGRISFINWLGFPQGGNTHGTCVAVFGDRFGSLRVSHRCRNELMEKINEK